MNLACSILALGTLVCAASAQEWHAAHFGGWPVPTVTNDNTLASLPIPIPGSSIRLVSTLTTTNTPRILGDLTGATITATLWMECSNSPVFFFNNDCHNGVPSNMRLFFTTDMRPYTERNGRVNCTNYWWSNPTGSWHPTVCGTFDLRATISPLEWSDALGHYAKDTNYTAAFNDCASRVAQIGLSIGGGCYYDVGVGISNEGATATLHVLQYDALRAPSSVTNLRLIETGVE